MVYDSIIWMFTIVLCCVDLDSFFGLYVWMDVYHIVVIMDGCLYILLCVGIKSRYKAGYFWEINKTGKIFKKKKQSQRPRAVADTVLATE